MCVDLFIEPLVTQKASRPPQDRTMVVACLAEVAQDMGAPIAGYVDVNFSLIYFLLLFLKFYLVM